MQAGHLTPSISATLRSAITVAGIALSMMAMAMPTQAQTVRKCSIEGRVVFQASECPVDRPSAAIAPSKTAAAELPAAPKKKSLADLIHERDATDAAHGPIREFKSDGADVLRSRMGAV